MSVVAYLFISFVYLVYLYTCIFIPLSLQHRNGCQNIIATLKWRKLDAQSTNSKILSASQILSSERTFCA